MRRVYLDWNASAPLDPRVLERMLPVLREVHGNPSSLHADGREARRAVEDAREEFAAAIGAEPREIVFTSGATEANNLAIAGLAAGRAGRILVSAIEHPSVLEAAEALGCAGRAVDLIPAGRDGRIDVDALGRLLGGGAAVVAVMAANNETGVIQPTAAVAALCARAGVPLHVDAVQALGRIPCSLDIPGIATASFSAHKIGGPKGAGALFVRAGMSLSPQIHGGGQERGRRAGTENAAAIVGLGAAASLARAQRESGARKLVDLGARLAARLMDLGVDFRWNGDPDPTARLPGTLNLGFPGISGEGMLFGLDLLGVSVSLGAACSSGAAKPSHVLAAMGLSKQENLESVRFSMGRGTTVEDVEAAAEAVAAVARRAPRVF